jgi:hypothetical protein
VPSVARHECPLPKLVAGADKIMGSGDTWLCPECTRTWVVTWIRQYGWATQPQWLCTTAPGAGSWGQQLTTVAAKFPLLQTVHLARVDVAAVAVNASVDVTFTWPTAFTSAAYLYDAPLPTATVGKLTVTRKTQTATALVLTIRPTTLAVAAFTWEALAWLSVA